LKFTSQNNILQIDSDDIQQAILGKVDPT